MIETMYDAPGIGLAAPQVGRSIRVLVMDVGGYDDEEEEPTRDLLVLINPEIVWASEEKRLFDEGCLSVPDFSAEVERPAQVHVKALDREGNERVIECDGLRAVCVQHEMDHLDGITIADRVSPLKRQIYLRKLRKGKIHRKTEDVTI
jgi:peptide deformylase